MQGCEYTFITAAISVIIALFALWYKNQKDNERARRTEIKSKIDKFEELSRELSIATNNYYSGDTSPISTAITMHGLLDANYRILEEIKTYKKGIDLTNQFGDIFDLITGDDFESKNFNPGLQHAELCKNIATRNGMIVSKLNNWFNKKFSSIYKLK